MNPLFHLGAALFLVLPLSAQSQSTSFEPGIYLTEKGWGTLTIKPAKGASQSFEISTVGGNGHNCLLEGEMSHGKAELRFDDSSKPCQVSFAPKGKDINVDSKTMEACDIFCGIRAGFVGLYMKTSPMCLPLAQQKTRKQFKRFYDEKAFAEARNRLEPLLTECGKTLHWLDEAWIRNDLAITLHKLGDFDGCLALLEPLAADAAKSDKEIRESYPPMEAQSVLPALKATRTNRRLCEAGKRAR